MGHESFLKPPNAGWNGRKCIGLGIEPGDKEFHEGRFLAGEGEAAFRKRCPQVKEVASGVLCAPEADPGARNLYGPLFSLRLKLGTLFAAWPHGRAGRAMLCLDFLSFGAAQIVVVDGPYTRLLRMERGNSDHGYLCPLDCGYFLTWD